ncbi:RidA family protein [Spongiactinospora sp. 9N601]|uniref:RidA family protein n=1 Tax=Spongiactinospora sp. 9N601 TaxID=3375149 RepID=UPI0037AD6362
MIAFGRHMPDLDLHAGQRDERGAYVDTERPPAGTAVQVAALFRPELLLEVEAPALVAEDAR